MHPIFVLQPPIGRVLKGRVDAGSVTPAAEPPEWSAVGDDPHPALRATFPQGKVWEKARYFLTISLFMPVSMPSAVSSYMGKSCPS